ncbi:TPA: P-loop NTPase fold protein [Vibrio vulnificus]|uniref:P-loop NTPase fold protein n=1 Tax=Vibrio vulnificus TaxID=672 RepID=UPI0010233A95|nr:P-loop NTPase fold protein [Vibrio vulnificus]MCA4021225.1 AAA family ATPase [Vibrio vulnificus]RZQ16180.1 hypothetical protein D8T50_13800 [Vibrio vulnificus]WNJ72339.1 P-loop NTPase fold protein [Vibrio vulnificus]
MGTSRNYQNEKPVDIDLFTGQGHKQVAEAIAKVLHSDSNQHIIGIEGNLGAGKSTVINILKQEIEANGFHLVTFDADQYHKNLKPALIKTIESELKKILGNKSYTQLEKLQAAVEKALGQRLEYTKKTKSHISLLAILFGFLLAVSALQVRPALSFLFDYLAGKNTTNLTTGFVSWGLFLCPVIVWFLGKHFSSNLSLGDLVKRNSKDTISETIDINREVGAIELREAFKTFANLIPTGKVLLLVVDNIDRVSPDIARELWSDIEILTSLGSERFRILLPYSEEHLAKALEKSAVDESQSGREFISKRIPVPFSAPPIVTTGWRTQFDAYWSETLPDISGKDGVKSLVDIWGKKITPRYLKSLVNRIGAKIDSCPEGNDLLNGVCCAAYILAVRDNCIPINELLSDPSKLVPKTENDEAFREAVRKLIATHRVLKKHSGERLDWSKQVAALHYQTSFEVAQSELIAEPIRIAFETHDTKTLVELKPLLGFDIFFSQQIEVTEPTELIKIAAALIEEDSGHQLVSEYLGDINHELKEAPDATAYEYDGELVSSYDDLIQMELDIDLTPITLRRNASYRAINKVWNKLDRLDSPTQGVAPNSLENLHSLIKENYAYSEIIQTRPHFITSPDASFIVHAIFPIANELDNWDINSLITKAKYKEVVKSACSRREYKQDTPSIFPLLLKQCRIGYLNSLNKESFLNINKLTNILEEVEAIPFTKDWHSTNANVLAIRLSVELGQATLGTIDETNLDRLCACAIATVIHGCAPNDQHSFRDINTNQDTHMIAYQWVSNTLQKRPTSKKHVTDYLCASKWDQIMTWSQHAVGRVDVLPFAENLIKNAQVNAAAPESLVKTYYSFINEHKCTLTNKEHVEWVATWEEFIKKISPKAWATELVDDAIQYQQPQLLDILLDYFDDEKITQLDWLTRIQQADHVTKKMINYMAENGKILNHSQALVNALKEIPSNNENYNIDLIHHITALLSPQNRGSVTRSLNRAFFKANTTHNQRYRSIHYFGDSITMPDLKEPEMIQDALDFIDNAVNQNNNQETLTWLFNQSFDKSGWCLDKWSQRELKDLQTILLTINQNDREMLLTAVNSHLDDEYEDETQQPLIV